MDKIKLLEQLSDLPEYLSGLVSQNGGISLLASCGADSSDCGSDGTSCTSDCSSDCSDCGSDGPSCINDSSCYTDTSCPKDGHPCYTDGILPCSSDCSTDGQIVNEWYAVKITADGISTMSIAYYDPDGDRIPSSGYDEYSFTKPQTFYVKAGKNLYIYKITEFDDGYGLPWAFEIDGDTGSSSRLNESGKTTTVNNSIFPESYCQVTISASQITLDRPDDWSWWSTVSSGSPIAITAREWNAFCTRINEFREYAELSSYSFTSVSKGTPISATIVNQARSAISGISGHGTLPSAAVSGGKITATFFNRLASALNSIP